LTSAKCFIREFWVSPKILTIESDSENCEKKSESEERQSDLRRSLRHYTTRLVVYLLTPTMPSVREVCVGRS